MAEGYDDIEMKNRDMREEEEEEEYKEAETDFGGGDETQRLLDDRRSRSVPVPIRSPIIRLDRRLRGLTYGEKIMKFKDIFNINLDERAGPSNKILLDETKFRENNKGNISIIFRDRKIGNFNFKDGEPNFLKQNKNFVEEFKDRMKEARKEYEKTPAAVINEKIGENERRNITDNSILQTQIRIDNIISDNNLKKFVDDKQDFRRTLFKRNELREFRGLIYLDDIPSNLSEEERKQVIQGKIDGFDKEYQHWGEKSELQPENTPQKDIYKNFSEIAKLQADKMRLENNMRPESDEVTQILEQETDQSDLGRLERFKEWAKENLLGLSAIGIAVAGIITTIVMGAKNALRQGAKAVGNFAKGIANIGKNFGALISSLLNLIGSILAFGAKGILFLSKNLWMLVVAITLFLYNEYRGRKK